MSFFEKIKSISKQHQADKKQLLREHNAELRKNGKDPLKGWGRAVNTGFGGINTKAMDHKQMDNFQFYLEEQAQIREKTDRK